MSELPQTQVSADDVEIKLRSLADSIARGFGKWYGGTDVLLSEAKVKRLRNEVRNIEIYVGSQRWRGRIIAFRGKVDSADLLEQLRRYKVRVPWSLIVIVGRYVTDAAIAFARANFIRLFQFSDVRPAKQQHRIAWEDQDFRFLVTGVSLAYYSPDPPRRDWRTDPRLILIRSYW
jgi:hypothetical protein